MRSTKLHQSMTCSQKLLQKDLYHGICQGSSTVQYFKASRIQLSSAAYLHSSAFLQNMRLNVNPIFAGSRQLWAATRLCCSTT